MRTVAFLFLILSYNLAYAQTDMPPNPEVGKCYAKCLIGPTYDTFEISFPVYLGEHPNENVKWEEILIFPGESIDIPVVKRMRIEDVDSTLIDWQAYTILEESSFGGYTEWREVVCNSDITADLVRRVQNALRSHGYDPGSNNNILGSETKAALKKFQIDRGLPIGGINVETMMELGLSY